MTERTPLVDLAARLLAKQELPPPSDDRAKLVAAARRALQERTRKRAVRRASWALAVAAAVGGLVAVGVVRRAHPVVAHVPPSSSPSVSAVTATAPQTAVMHKLAGEVVTIHNGEKLASAGFEVPVGPGDRVVAANDGRATLTLPTGTHFLIEPATDVAIVQENTTQLFELAHGAVRLDVAKLRPGERFVLRTGEIEVEVRGTSFRVATSEPDANCGGELTPRVVVYEGEVVVRKGANEAHVKAGQSWSRCSNDATPVASASIGDPPKAGPVSSSVTPKPSVVPNAPAEPAHPPKSALAEQNAAFAAAIDAKRRGDFAAAVDGFEQFRARYPHSVLTEAAMAEEMKILAKTDKSRAVALARAYLLSYPNGFAAQEARALISSP